MNVAQPSCWPRRLATICGAFALLALSWLFSTRTPVLSKPDSPWIPLAFSPDTKILAASKSRERKELWTGEPAGPIHLLRAADLTAVETAIQPPTIEIDSGSYFPRIQHVEFSRRKDRLAILQDHHDGRQKDILELHVFRLPGGDLWKSFPIPIDYHQRRGGIARQFFSSDGQLLVWHEYVNGVNHAQDARHTIRVWDLAAECERFVADGAAFPVFSPDSSLLAAVETQQNGGIACRLYETRTGQLLRSLTLSGDDFGWQPWPEFSPDGQFVAVNCASSSGKGPAVSVFEVASGKNVFKAAEWSPHFVAGPMLVTVKDTSIVFRETHSWQIRAQTKVDLGLDGVSGTPRSPEPAAIPDRSAVIVYDVRSPANRYLPHFLRRRPGAYWIEGGSGQVTGFPADVGIFNQFVVSPDGQRLAVRNLSAFEIWALPPQRSRLPTAFVAGLLVIAWCGWMVFYRQPTRVGDSSPNPTAVHE